MLENQPEVSEASIKWDLIAMKLASTSRLRAGRRPKPSDDPWDNWSILQLKGNNGPNLYYFPSAIGSLTFRSTGGFIYEDEFQIAWRNASNRMKRQGDMWKNHVKSYEDLWGHQMGNVQVVHRCINLMKSALTQEERTIPRTRESINRRGVRAVVDKQKLAEVFVFSN